MKDRAFHPTLIKKFIRMKKSIFILFLSFVSANCFSQYVFTEKDSLFKTTKTPLVIDKSFANILEDPYNPTACAFASFFLPGIGQIICKEKEKGSAFLFTDLAMVAISFAGFNKLASTSSNYDIDKGARMFLFGGIGSLIVSTWAAIDASHTAKIANGKYRIKINGNNLKVIPYLNLADTESINTIPIGMSMKLNF